MKTADKKSKPNPTKQRTTHGSPRRKTGEVQTVQSSAVETVLQLRNLRLQTREIALNQSNKLQSDISQLIEDIQAVKVISRNSKSQDAMRTMNKIFQILQNLKLKPEKGRFKDLRRVHDTTKILRRLCNTLDQ